jgi:hypothetical protein
MRLSVALAGFVWLVGSGGAAHADMLGSGALFGSGQAVASCTVTNVGPFLQGSVSVGIFSSDGSPVSVTFQNCDGVAFKPGDVCNKNATLSATLLYSCQVDTGRNPGHQVRGTMIIYDSSNRILGTSDLR